jgi:hypothetical protein
MQHRLQEDHADLGLVDDDDTEDLREKRTPPAATRGVQNNFEPTNHHEGDSLP